MPLRKISLGGLDAAMPAALDRPASPCRTNCIVLGGLQQIRYVFVYPEQKDIVLVGPAEGWKVDAPRQLRGRHHRPAGDAAGRPAGGACGRRGRGPGGITCSIDPTAEGMQQLRAYVSQAAHDRQPGRRPRRASSRPWAGSRSRFTGVPATQPFRRGAVGGRLSHEAAGDELRAFAGPRAAELPAHAQRHAARA